MLIKKLLPLFILLPSLAYATDSPPSLSQIQAQIQTVRKDIKQQHVNRDQAQQKLQQAETQLGNAVLRQQEATAEQKNQQAILKALLKKQAQYERNLNAQKQTLTAQIRSAYRMGEQEYLRLLLNQQDPSMLSRNMTYYEYLARHQAKMIQQFNVLLQQINENKRAMEERTAQLTALQSQQKQQVVEIKSKRAERTASLIQLNKMIKSKDEQLKQLLANKAALEHAMQQATLAAAKQRMVGGEVVWPGGGSFEKAKGKLSWPTQGRILAAFNSLIDQSQIKQTGVLLGAGENQNVYAIAPGRVVFADWMPGYGLLMIVSHGQGYMTLYGRNGSLFKQVGDTVKPAERIATVGKTGGYDASALYFAIRKNGTPLDPQLWCKG